MARPRKIVTRVKELGPCLACGGTAWQAGDRRQCPTCGAHMDANGAAYFNVVHDEGGLYAEAAPRWFIDLTKGGGNVQ